MLVLSGAFILKSGPSYLVFVDLFLRFKDCLGLANISFTHLIVRLSRLVLVFLLSHRLCEFCYFLIILSEYDVLFSNKSC